MRLRFPRIRTIVILIGITVVGGALAFYGIGAGWYVHRRAPAELAHLLAPSQLVLRPAGAGPFPAVLMFHGCGGVRQADRQWAEFFQQQGFVAVVVDSIGPRGLREHWRDVCRGTILWGRERAGDVLVTLDEVRKWPFVDPKRVVLAGWSHGGWAVMDLLALDPPKGVPTSLVAAPAGLEGVAGILLVYPYAGFGALSASSPWQTKAPSLMLLSGKDSVVPTPAALATAAYQRNHGQEIDVHVYDGLDHCWDQTDLPKDWRLKFDAAATADARARVAAFLQKITSIN
jgi:dienelactone hydrolase